MNKHPLSVLLAITLFSPHLNASPTSNEFERCNSIAIAELKYCLRDRLSDNSLPCWERSRTSFFRCSDQVKESHSGSVLPKRNAIKDNQ